MPSLSLQVTLRALELQFPLLLIMSIVDNPTATWADIPTWHLKLFTVFCEQCSLLEFQLHQPKGNDSTPSVNATDPEHESMMQHSVVTLY